MDEESVARRAVALLAEEGLLPAGRYVDTAAVARHVGVSEDWVRDHAAELGAIRVGDGPTGALRFDARKVRGALERRRLRQSDGSSPRRTAGHRRKHGAVELLPLPGEGGR
jgi:hypothetical protein